MCVKATMTFAVTYLLLLLFHIYYFYLLFFLFLGILLSLDIISFLTRSQTHSLCSGSAEF